MKKLELLCAGLWLMVIPLTFLHPQNDAGVIAGKMKLSTGAVEYSVSYDGGKKDWAEYVLSGIGRYLEASEKYLAEKFPGVDSFPVNGKEEVTYRGVRVGGKNLGDSVELEYGISKRGEPALLFHELGHFWYGYPDGGDGSSEELSWLVEGVVSFLPVAMQTPFGKVKQHRIYSSSHIGTPI